MGTSLVVIGDELLDDPLQGPRVERNDVIQALGFCQISGQAGLGSPHPRNGEGTLLACPDCASTATTRRKGRTALGSRRFRCQAWRRRFNDLQYPTDSVLLAVRWRLRSTLGFRDVAALLLQRGFEVTHETIRAWEVRFAPRLAGPLRAKRRGQAGGSWYLDETSVQVAGRWCALDRALDREGVLLDSRRSAHRDKHAARRLPAAPGRGGRAQAAARHHGQASALPQSDPRDPGTEGRAPDESIPQQPHGTGPPRGAAALLPDARFRELRLSGTLLLGV